MVSCVEAKEPHRVHPHKLDGTGTGGTVKAGVIFMTFPEDMTIQFNDLR